MSRSRIRFKKEVLVVLRFAIGIDILLGVGLIVLGQATVGGVLMLSGLACVVLTYLVARA